MRACVLPLLAVALAQPAWAGTPAPPAIRPALIVIDPVVPPSPMPGPATVVTLEPGRFELIRLTGYQGKASWRVLPANGPVQCSRLKPGSQVLAVPPEAGDTPAIEVREVGTLVVLGTKAGATSGGTYSVGDEPAVLVRPVKGKIGTATIEAWGINADGEPALLVELLVQVGHAPQPPPPGPSPDPQPQPKPPVPASPVAFLVVVEETADAVAGRGAFFADPALAQQMKARSLKWRVVDKDVVGADGKPPADVARFLVLAAGKPYPSLFLVDAAGKLIDHRPVPRTPADLLALLTQFGG